MIDSVIGGKYRIVKLLGEGGMGAVYEGREEATGRRLAVKVITGDIVKSETPLLRFQQEARAASALSTPHIIEVIEAGTDAATGLPFMAMEYLEGEDLQGALERHGVLPVDTVLRIGAQVCMGLEKAHAARVLHRDIKPANLFLVRRPGGERVVKILDFGIAKIKNDATGSNPTAKLTRTGSVLGSPLYMSPEQARSQRTIDYRSDLWSLSVVMYQALAGTAPHQDIESLVELIINICSEPPPPLTQVAPWVPPEVAAVVHRNLRMQAKERFQTAGEMLAALRALLPNGAGLSDAMLRPLSAEERARRSPHAMQRPAMQRPALQQPAMPQASMQQPAMHPPAMHPPAMHPPAMQQPAMQQAGMRASYPGAPSSMAQPDMRGSYPGAPASGGYAAAPGPVSSGPYGAGGAPPPYAGPAQARTAAGAQAPPRRGGAAKLVLAVVGLGMLAAGAIALLGSATSSPPPIRPSPASTTRGDPGQAVVVMISPGDARVEVDDAPAALKDGAAVIRGPVGSVHRVRVSAGGVEREEYVTVTELGADPPSIRLTPDAPPPPRPPGAAPAATPAAANTAPAPTRAPTTVSCTSPDYHWDEAKNAGGPNRCTSPCECDGMRTCSGFGFCQGTSR